MFKINVKSIIPLIFWASMAAGQSPLDAPRPVQTDIRPENVIHWQAAGGQTFADGTIELGVRLFTEQGFTLYTDKVSFSVPPGYEIQTLVSPPSVKQYDPISRAEVNVFSGGDFKVLISGVEKWTKDKFPISIKSIGCTTSICLFPYTVVVEVPVYPSTEAVSELSTGDDAGGSVGDDEESWDTQLASQLASGGSSTWLLFLIVFLGGLLTNLTPCVAPMIPITVRLLGNQNLSPLLNSTLYASGIMVTYTGLGSIAVFSGSAFGTFMSSVPLNIGFSVVMALLGLSMLGFGNLAFLQGIGARIGSGKPSARNTFLMGAGAGLVAAPCTGPVLGALLAYTSGQQSSLQGVILMASYSLGFALPYVMLGGVAAKASTMKVSPNIQLMIKLTFASVMFGLSLYYLRIPAYELLQILRPYWGSTAAALLPLGVVLVVIYLVSPKFQHRKVFMMVPSLVLGVGLFAGSQWLTSSGDIGASDGLKWHKSLEEGFAAARESNKPILMDHWAEWCEACKKMDVTTFVDPRVVRELKEHWVLIKLDLTKGTDEDDDHMDKYGISGLPTLVLLDSEAMQLSQENVVGYVSGGGLLKRLRAYKTKGL